MKSPTAIELEQQYSANNYLPIPVVLTRGEGVYAWDVDGHRYLDMMAAYSAVSFGHRHPRMIKALTDQLHRLDVTSRAFYTDRLGPFLKRACELTKQDRALPMNSGAEGVETAIKAARKWAYTVKGVPENKAEIITCRRNFHGRTTTVISFSTETQYREGFGPFTPGFITIDFGDADALEKAITLHTAAFLVEVIQGEGGIIVPPEGYIKRCAEICRKHNVLLICDEIQTGMGRTGKFLACEHEGVHPDGVILGKALGGGLYPVSLFLSKKEVMDVFHPGDHGSTFGGNPLACAIGLEALNTLMDERLIERSAELGDYMLTTLKKIKSPLIKEVRGKGLFIGLEIEPKYATARQVCLQLMKNGLLSKETHETVVRLAPPLVITREQLDDAIEIIHNSLSEIAK